MMTDDRVTMDDVAQFDTRVQMSVLDAVARVYAAGMMSSNSTSHDIRKSYARDGVDDFLQIISPLILGSKN